MHKSHWIIASAALALLVGMSGGAHAQQKMRPGLWEHHIRMHSQSGEIEAAMAQMQQAMADMPPEQRKQMEQMLAQQGVGLGPKGQTVKVCITPAQAEADHLPQQKGCTQNVQRIDANTTKLSFSCQGGPDHPPPAARARCVCKGPRPTAGNFGSRPRAQRASPSRST